jgi:hypothetical protein
MAERGWNTCWSCPGSLFGILLILIGVSAPFSIGRLLSGCVLLFSSYTVLRSAWKGIRQPNILIEKSTQSIGLKPTLVGGEKRSWSFSQFTGVAVWRSSQIRVGLAAEDVYQAGLVSSEGQPVPLVEVSATKRERTAESLASATGLGIMQIGQ